MGIDWKERLERQEEDERLFRAIKTGDYGYAARWPGLQGAIAKLNALTPAQRQVYTAAATQVANTPSLGAQLPGL